MVLQASQKKKFKITFVLRVLSLFFLSLLIISYFYLSRPKNIEKILVFAVSKFTSGNIQLTVKDFSLLKGFVFENIIVRSGDDFQNRSLLTLERLVFRYYLPGLWVRQLGVNELGIYNAHFYLREQNKKWNIVTLFQKNSSAPSPEKNTKPLSSINWFFDIKVFARIVLQNFNFTMQTSQPNMQAEVKNFNLITSLSSRSFHELPLNFSALQLLDSFMLQVNPRHKPSLSFKNSQITTGKNSAFTLLLNFDKHKNILTFFSTALMGNKDIPFTYKGQKNMPFDFLLSYDMHYQPEQDVLEISYLTVSFLKDPLISLKGKIEYLTNKERFFCDIAMQESLIDFKKLHPYFTYFTGNKNLLFQGVASLAPFHLKGSWHNLKLNGKISFENVRLQQNYLDLLLSFLDIDYQATADLSRNRQKPLPYFKDLKIDGKGELNKSTIDLDIDYQPSQKVWLKFSMQDLQPQEFANYIAKDLLKKPFAFRGALNFLFQVQGKNESNLNSSLRLYSNQFSYRINHGFSPVTGLNLNILSKLNASDKSFRSLHIKNPKINLDLQNKKSEKALWLNARGNLTKGDNFFSYRLDVDPLETHITTLQSILPFEYQEKLEKLAEKIPNKIQLKGYSIFKNDKNQKTLQNYYHFDIDDLDLHDIKITNKNILAKDDIQIQELKLNGLNNSLLASVKGNFKKSLVEKLDSKTGKIIKTQGLMPFLDTEISLGRKERTEIFTDNFIKGDIHLKSKIKGNIIQGNLTISNFYYEKGKYKINDINLKFPFEHNLLLKKKLDLTYATKERIIKNYNFSKPYNLTIRSVEIPHPIIHNEIFLAAYPVESYEGISAYAFYKDNVFQMPVMQIYTLNGLVTLKNILFNVGQGKPSKMEYVLQAQVKNTDLKQLIPPKKAEAIQDGAIHMDMNFVGRGIQPNISGTLEELNGNIAIYKVGKEFGKQALKVVKPNSIIFIDLAVDQSVIVDRMDMDFKEGLVYAKVYYHKGLLGAFIGPAGNQLIQERIPILEYWQRAKEEAKTYKLETSNSKEENEQ